ncbi:L-xylulose reductase-like protein [Leptotrombidium deliense]|uniref:L-xylulose reductase-like protein n=1 Tax=Leptotrombidium deliense TaxID=299467 RepID=A0A443S6F2_9ACAR|nr:L-xylulose reductase-like protein [Leptotrombidium deliense]
MEICLEGKRALVTGAANGIGKGVAVKLLECGAEVIAFDKDEENLKRLKKEYSKIEIHTVDISNWENTKKLVSEIGTIDLLVNNAAIQRMNEIGNISDEEFDSFFAVNVKALINITQEVAKGMIENKRVGCSIVNVSSTGSKCAVNSTLVYGAAKAAVNQITKVSALELGKHQIRVNAILPGVVKSGMYYEVTQDFLNAFLARIPMQRAAEANDVANLVAFLLSDKSDMITGVCIPIDGGYTAC